MAELDNLFGGENKPAEPAATSKEDWQITTGTNLEVTPPNLRAIS